MSLSVFCATRAEDHVWPFLLDMVTVARRCGGEFVMVADGAVAWDRLTNGDFPDDVIPAIDGVHRTMERAIQNNTSDYVLVLDDDERCTAGLVEWLASESYLGTDFWDIPRAWLFRDTKHFITSRKHWPNYDLRVGRRILVSVPTVIHHGWMARAGTSAECAHAIEHHKLLIRSLEDRIALVKHYESIKKDAGLPKQYLPELLLVDVAEWNG